MARPKLTVYLDTVSPFAYLAFFVVNTSPVFKQCDVTFIPVFLGGIMHACGNKPPVEIKNKGPWVQVDRMRWARQFNVPMADLMPEGFPAVTLPVQRALCAMTIACPGRIPDAFAALYHASFVERKPIHNAELFMPILEKFLGKEVAEEVLAKSTVPETKKLLTAKTDEAFREGAFGLPWFAATNAEGAKECFWGFDHIGQVAHHLGIEKPKDGSVDGGGWKAML